MRNFYFWFMIFDYWQDHYKSVYQVSFCYEFIPGFKSYLTSWTWLSPSLLLIWSFLQCSPPFPSLLWPFLQYPFLSDDFRRLSLSYWCILFVAAVILGLVPSSSTINICDWNEIQNLKTQEIRIAIQTCKRSKSAKIYGCLMKHPTKPVQHGKFILLRQNMLDETLCWNKLHPTSSNMIFSSFLKL